MEYIVDAPPVEESKILCCQCGTPIPPNPANTCVPCLRSRIDITEAIPKQGTLQWCKGCERYLNPPNQWVQCALESKELLSLCLKRLKGMNTVRLVDASFVWTEPHSKRIKVKLSVQKEVQGGAILQQVFVVEFIVANQMCEACHRTEAKDFWKAVVQVRQKVDHRKTMFYLEQMILKHNAHENTLGIKPKHEGLDFFYANENQARKLVDFISAVVPCRSQHSKKQISHDAHSNIFNYKFSWSVDIVPVCKNDIVTLPVKLARSLGSMSQLAVVHRVGNTIRLIDPRTAQVADVTHVVYYRHPFHSLAAAKSLAEFTVMDVEPVPFKELPSFPGQGATSERHVLADCWVVRSSELGISSNTIHCRTHLGALLKPGDLVLGLDLANTNVNDQNFEKMVASGMDIPEVILVRKIYGDKARRKRKRQWKVKRMAEGMEDIDEGAFTEFLDDLEEDPEYRTGINIYKDPKGAADLEVEASDNEEFPRISLQEMMDDLTLEDDPMGEK